MGWLRSSLRNQLRSDPILTKAAGIGYYPQAIPHNLQAAVGKHHGHAGPLRERG